MYSREKSDYMLFTNIECLISCTLMVLGLCLTLIFMCKFGCRPTLEIKYVYNNKIMLMTNGCDTPFKYDKDIFLRGNYLDVVEKFVVKEESL